MAANFYLLGRSVGWLFGLLRHAIENMHSPLLDLETIFKENAPEHADLNAFANYYFLSFKERVRLIVLKTIQTKKD